MTGSIHFEHGRAVDLRLDRVGQKARCVGAVVQVVQLGSAGRVGPIKARDGAQLHVGDDKLPLRVLGHGAHGGVGVAVEPIARAAGEVHKPQHVTARQGRDIGFFRVHRCRVGIRQRHDMG
ncbi:hypothetical protein AE621_24455 [Acidovorax sp. SD340]|nr:hypothetical protein AE621_24455 [Acidovorax sp. SD340]